MEEYADINDPVQESGSVLPPTDDVRSRTMALLDFDTVRARLADHTSFYPARRLALFCIRELRGAAGDGSRYL